MRLRPATRDDAEAALAVVEARDVADIGHPDFTLDDLLEEWDELDLDSDTFLVEDDDGTIVGYASVDPRGTMVLVHPQAEGRGVGTLLRAAVEARVAARGERLRQIITASNTAAIEHLEAVGYHRAHVYQRMTADLSDVPPAPEDPRIRTFDLETEGEAVHALIERAFTEIPGNVGVAYESWLGYMHRREYLFVAEVDGELAGAATGERWEDETGYVAQIATTPEARGLGLGRALLLTMLAAFKRDGLTTADLSVHGTNAPATGLYESAGMKPSWRQERWERG